MTDTLIKLFGSETRVRLLRLFLFNPNQTITAAEAATRAQVRPKEARQEITLLLRAGLLTRYPRNSAARFGLAEGSPYVAALQNLLLDAPTRASQMPTRLRSVGTLKLIVVAGIFVGQWEAGLDLLVVGDRIKEKVLLKKVKMLEAEVGKEVRYASMSTQDFFYRLNLSDRLLRDIFDYDHTIVLDRLDIGLK